MKPKEYIKKYGTDKSLNYDRKSFVADFTFDFMNTIECMQSCNQMQFVNFQNVIKQLRQKFDGIVNKSLGTSDQWEKQWKFFYATVVVKVRDEMFGDILRKKKEAHEKRKRDWERIHSFSPGVEDTYEFFRAQFSMLMSALSASVYPIKEFALLGLNKDADVDDIKNSFRRLAKEKDPDKGGSNREMQVLIEAKNKCLQYVERNN